MGSTFYDQLASEWLRALRGKRSQKSCSRRLGYSSNIAYRWEAGHCAPTVTRTFRAIERLGGDVVASLRTFYRQSPRWLERLDPCSRRGVAQLLNDLRGKTTISSLAEQTELSRFAISRWLKADADPPLPAFLQLVDVSSLRLLDFLGAFGDPSQLASVAEQWQRLQEARQTAYTHPWSHAVLRVLELQTYRALPNHKVGWIASNIGVSKAEEEESLALLERIGQVRWNGTHYESHAVHVVDTRNEPEHARALKRHWCQVALDRLEAGSEGLFSYNLSVVSRKDLLRIQDLQRAHYREMRRIIADSQPGECVALYAAQLLPLSKS